MNYNPAWKLYGFKRPVFGALESRDQYFRTGAEDLVRGVIRNALEHRTIEAILADKGAGKTTTFDVVLAALDREIPNAKVLKIKPANSRRYTLHDFQFDITELAKEEEIKIASYSHMRMNNRVRRVLQALTQKYQGGLVILIDNAHDLSGQTIRSFRQMIENPYGFPQHLCGMVFVGWMHLANNFKMLSDVDFRTELHELPVLTPLEVQELIVHRIVTAGGKADFVDQDVLEYMGNRDHDEHRNPLRTPLQVCRLMQAAVDRAAKLGRKKISLEIMYQLDANRQPLKILWVQCGEPSSRVLEELTGIDHSTINRCINDPAYGDPETIARIQAAMRKAKEEELKTARDLKKTA